MNPGGACLLMSFAVLLYAQGTVVFSGRITDSVTGQPIEGAGVVLEQGASHGSQLTDSAGNFSFDDDIMPGDGRIQIQKEGYVLFQRSNPDESAVHVSGDHSEHNFRLTAAGSISGKIAREDGVKIVVTLLQEDFTGGVSRFVAAASTNSSFGIGADGVFRFVGLEPGRYIVSASTQPGGGQFASEFVCQQGNCAAVFGPGEEPAADAPREGYVTTYYPGTTQFADALPVTLASGEKRAMDFRMAKRPLFRVSGEIEGPGVEHAQVPLIFKMTDGGPGESARANVTSVLGSFTVSGLSAGQYTGSAFGAQNNISFAITDHDVSGLRWVVHPAQRQPTVDGSFRMVTSGTALPIGLSVQFAWPLPGESTPTSVSGNGHFVLAAQPGDYSVLPVVPPGYAVTELRYGGANYLHRLIPMKGDSIDSSLTIVLSNQPGTVGGSILDGEQKPVPAKVVLVPDPLPANFDLWAIRVAITDTDGTFALRGLAPGRYKAVALTGDERKRDHDFAILADKLRAAEAFEVVAGRSVNVNVDQVTGRDR